jgi:hypothetical protein
MEGVWDMLNLLRISSSIRLGLVTLAASGLTSATGQILTPTRQSRTVHVSVSGPEGSDSRDAAADGFELWDQTVSLSMGDAHVGAHQRSEIGGTFITGFGGTSPYVFHFPSQYSCNGNTGLSVTFEIAEPAAFRLSGSVVADPFAAASVHLGVYGAVVSSGGAQDFAFAGVIPAGEHNLNAHASAVSAGGPQSVTGTFVVELTLSVPGDLDGDCVIDLSDLALLLSHFGTPTGAAYADGDVDGDADVDLNDLILLLDNYGRMCP